MIGTLNSQATIIESPWGQYYKLEYQTNSPLEKSYRISQAVKSLEDTAESLREASRERELVQNQQHQQHQQNQTLFGGGFGNAGSASLGDNLFGTPGQTNNTSTPKPASGGYFGGTGAPETKPIGGLFGSQPGRPQPSTSAFGAPASQFSSLFGSKEARTPKLEKPGIEKYALTETAYPGTALSGLVLQDWFLNGNDNIENAFVATDQPAILKALLSAISQPGFETVLRLKLLNDNKMYMERISCASAYVIKVFHRQGLEAFTYIIRHSPSNVLLDIALFSRGALIPEAMQYQVLQAAAVTLTTSEPKEAREVTYARAVAAMIARIIDQFYKEEASLGTSEGERAEKLKERMSLLITQVSEAPAITPMPNNRRSVITASAALSGLILAGVLTFADDLQKRREKNLARAELSVTAVLSCIGFAVPVPYFAAVSGLATVLGSAIVKHIWRPKDPELKSTLVIQTLQTVLWPLVRRREVLPVGLVGLSFEEASEFKMFFELVLQSAWMRYWHCN